MQQFTYSERDERDNLKMVIISGRVTGIYRRFFFNLFLFRFLLTLFRSQQATIWRGMDKADIM